VKIYGEDLQVLENKAVEIKRILSQVPGFTELTVVRELGQPSTKSTPAHCSSTTLNVVRFPIECSAVGRTPH